MGLHKNTNAPVFVNLNNSSGLTASPYPDLGFQVGGDDGKDLFNLFQTYGVSGGGHCSTIHSVYSASRGTRAAPTAIGTTVDASPTYVGSLGDYIYAALGTGTDSTGTVDVTGRTGFAFRPSESWASGAHGAEMVVLVTPNGSLNSFWRFRFGNEGCFYINKSSAVPESALIPNATTIRSVGADGTQNIFQSDTYGSNSIWLASASGGTRNSKTAFAAGTMLTIGTQAWDSAAFGVNATIVANTLNTQSVTDHSTYWAFSTVKSGQTTLTEDVRISGGNLQMGGANTVLDSNRIYNARSYTVATLPTAGIRGRTVDCSNGRMFNGAGVLEGAGAGTGGLVEDNGTNWKIAGTNITVSA